MTDIVAEAQRCHAPTTQQDSPLHSHGARPDFPASSEGWRVELTGAMLKPHDSVPHCMPMVRGLQQPFSPAQVLLVEDVRGGPGDDGHGKTGNPGEQNRGLVEARVCKVVEHGACTGGKRFCWKQVSVSFSGAPRKPCLQQWCS